MPMRRLGACQRAPVIELQVCSRDVVVGIGAIQIGVYDERVMLEGLSVLFTDEQMICQMHAHDKIARLLCE